MLLSRKQIKAVDASRLQVWGFVFLSEKFGRICLIEHDDNKLIGFHSSRPKKLNDHKQRSV
jgi:hypothetical protein